MLLVSFFVSRHDAIRLAFLQFATCAVVSLLLALIFEHQSGQHLARRPVIYGGLFAVASATLQVVAQKHAIASHAAIILSLERSLRQSPAPVPRESLTLRGYMGCVLMFIGMLAAQLCAPAGTAGYRCPGPLRPHSRQIRYLQCPVRSVVQIRLAIVAAPR